MNYLMIRVVVYEQGGSLLVAAFCDFFVFAYISLSAAHRIAQYQQAWLLLGHFRGT